MALFSVCVKRYQHTSKGQFLTFLEETSDVRIRIQIQGFLSWIWIHVSAIALIAPQVLLQIVGGNGGKGASNFLCAFDNSNKHSQKKGYRKSTPGVLLLQTTPFFSEGCFFQPFLCENSTPLPMGCQNSTPRSAKLRTAK